MIRSMTGYGKYQHIDEELSFDIEMKSVNSRYLDINIKMPNHLNYLEDKIKKIIKEHISRGRVDIFIRTQRKGILSSNISINLDIAKEMKDKLSNISEYIGIENKVSLSDILKNEDVLMYEPKEIDEDKMFEVIKISLLNVLSNLDFMRREEGKALYDDLYLNIQKLRKIKNKISEYSTHVAGEQKKRLTENIEKLLDKRVEIDSDRIAVEVAFWADKADINEELIRLNSHFEQFENNLKSDIPVGKKLDFISQEMLRETNTIGSKSSKIEITENVIEAKSIIEKIKEQVQNVE